MRSASRRTLRYSARSLAPVAVLAAALAFTLGPAGPWVAILVAIPWLAWRYDNDSGTFLVFAVLLVLVLGTCAMLLVLIALTH